MGFDSYCISTYVMKILFYTSWHK